MKLSISNIDPTKVTIAASGKEKLDQMKDWHEIPFREYQCNKHSSHFFIFKKHKKANYAAAQCNSWSNKNCGNKMCSKCCMILQTESGKVSACKTKEHQPIHLAQRVGGNSKGEGVGQREDDASR